MPRTKGLKDYSSELKDKVVKERKAGASLRQIAQKYNVSVYSVGAGCINLRPPGEYPVIPTPLQSYFLFAWITTKRHR